MGVAEVIAFAAIAGVGYVVVKRRRDQSEPAAAQFVAVKTTTPRRSADMGAAIQQSSKAFAGLIGDIFGGRRSGSPETTDTGQGAPSGGVFGLTLPNVRQTVSAPNVQAREERAKVARAGDPKTREEWGQRLARDLQSDFGLTPAQAAGFVGNLDHESAGFRTLQEIQPMTYRGGVLVPSDTARGGYGIAQWTGPRRRDFEAWAKANGLDMDTYAANYGFLKHELTNTSERRVLTSLRSARNVSEATDIVMRKFLRPGILHAESRLQRAKEYI